MLSILNLAKFILNFYCKLDGTQWFFHVFSLSVRHREKYIIWRTESWPCEKHGFPTTPSVYRCALSMLVANASRKWKCDHWIRKACCVTGYQRNARDKIPERTSRQTTRGFLCAIVHSCQTPNIYLANFWQPTTCFASTASRHLLLGNSFNDS